MSPFYSVTHCITPLTDFKTAVPDAGGVNHELDVPFEVSTPADGLGSANGMYLMVKLRTSVYSLGLNTVK